MEYNKSLSARIRRRNKQEFSGAGTPAWDKSTSFGDYKDPSGNYKCIDYENEQRRKSKLKYRNRDYKFDEKGNLIYTGFRSHTMSKRYADKHQKLN